jgi:ribose transport system substrate-binding protein
MSRRSRPTWPRLAAVTTAAIASLALAACGSSSSSTTNSGGSGSSTAPAASGSASATTSATTSAAKKTPNLAMITASTTQNAFEEMADGATEAAAVLGVHLTEAAPNGVNPTQEVQELQSAEQTSKDGIAVMTTAPSDFIRPFASAVSAGIPIVAVDAAPLPGSNVNTFVGNSNTQVGELMAEQIIKKIPANATGEVVIGNDIPGLPLLQLRIDGMIKVLKASRPGLKIVGPFNVGSEPTQNYDNWVNVVKAHPNAVAYLAPGDQDAVSLFRIEKQNGTHYLVGACDVDPIALQAVQQGYVDALGDPEHFLKGYMATWLLYQHAVNGTALPTGWLNPGAGVITKANVASIVTREKNNANRLAWYKAIIAKETANPSAYIKPLKQAN